MLNFEVSEFRNAGLLYGHGCAAGADHEHAVADHFVVQVDADYSIGTHLIGLLHSIQKNRLPPLRTHRQDMHRRAGQVFDGPDVRQGIRRQIGFALDVVC